MKIAFYEHFIELCAIRDIKPTPALKDMRLSTGNLQKWQKPDAVITVDTLEKIAEYFGVPPTYFFDDNIRNTEKSKAELDNAKAELNKLILDEIAQCEEYLHRLKKIQNNLQKKRGA